MSNNHTKDNTKDNTKDKFVKQRRLLLGVSIVLSLYLLTGISLDTVNVFGNTFQVSNPEHIETSLWILWTYFLLRYYQHSKNLRTQEKDNLMYDLTRKYVGKKAYKDFVKSSQENTKEEGSHNYTYKGIVHYDVKGGYYHHITISTSIVSTSPDQLKKAASSPEPTKTFTPEEIKVPKILSYLELYFITPYGTEYCLPYILSTAPVLLCLFQ